MAQPSLDLLIGKPVSHVWFGHGSALFLELGTLSESKRANGTAGNPKDEITVMTDFGWRIEGQRSVVCGSGESECRMASAVQKLLGASVVAAQAAGRIPELQIELSNKLWLATFSRYQGQPTWALLFNSPKLGALGVQGGKVVAEASTPNQSFKADGVPPRP